MTIQEHPNDEPFRQARVTLSPAAQKLDDHLADSIAHLTPLPTVNLTEGKPMTTPPPVPGSFAASIRAMMDEARAGVAQARSDGLAKVGEAVGKLTDAKVSIAKVSASMATTIEEEAASVLSELGQISNDL